MSTMPQTSDPAAAHSAALVYPVDTEHGGIRLLVPLLSIGSFFALYLGINALPSPQAQDYLGCAAFAAGVLGAVGMAFLSDRVLKRIWPSSRHLALDVGLLILRDKRRPNTDVQIRLGDRLNALTWRFTVKRGSSRVQRGWHMLALQLTQDETQLSLYTFMSPKHAEALPAFSQFTSLIPRSALDKGEVPLREAAQQRRLLAAEDARWQEGAELQANDFVALLERLTPHIPDWEARR